MDIEAKSRSTVGEGWECGVEEENWSRSRVG